MTEAHWWATDNVSLIRQHSCITDPVQVNFIIQNSQSDFTKNGFRHEFLLNQFGVKGFRSFGKARINWNRELFALRLVIPIFMTITLSGFRARLQEGGSQTLHLLPTFSFQFPLFFLAEQRSARQRNSIEFTQYGTAICEQQYHTAELWEANSLKQTGFIVQWNHLRHLIKQRLYTTRRYKYDFHLKKKKSLKCKNRRKKKLMDHNAETRIQIW